MDQLDLDAVLLSAFHALLEHSPDHIFLKDLNLRYLCASRAFANMVGFAHGSELVGKSDFDVFNHELATRYTRDDHNLLKSGVPILNHVEPLPDTDGRKKYGSTSKYLLHDKDGRLIGLYGTSRDVTAQIELEEERESRRISRQMFEGVFEVDLTERRILRLEGSAWVRELGLSSTNDFSMLVNTLAERFIHPDYVGKFRRACTVERLLAAYEKGNTELSFITYLRSNGKDYKWIEFKTRLFYARTTNTLRSTTVLNDLDDEIRIRERLRQRAETDALTGLPNRDCIVKKVQECLAGRATQTHVLLFVDLDGFKQVNDRFGHPFGDKVLQKIAQRLRMVFSSDELIGRVGGDEFLVLLQNVASPEDARRRTAQICETVPFYQFEDGHEIYVTCSVGASMHIGGDGQFETLYQQADQAMYRAKHAGKNQLIFFDDAQ